MATIAETTTHVPTQTLPVTHDAEHRTTETGIGARAGRYMAVTLVASPANLAIYAALLAWTTWPAVAANLAAASIIVIPTFIVTRWWVWEVRDRHALGREISIYWATTAMNVAVSSATATALDAAGASNRVLVAATFMVYGLLWLIRFGILDRLFSSHHRR